MISSPHVAADEMTHESEPVTVVIAVTETGTVAETRVGIETTISESAQARIGPPHNGTNPERRVDATAVTHQQQLLRMSTVVQNLDTIGALLDALKGK